MKEAGGDDDLIEGAFALHVQLIETCGGVEVCADDHGYSLCTWESHTLFSLYVSFIRKDTGQPSW